MQNEYVIILLLIVSVIMGIWYKKGISNTCSEEDQIQIIDDGGKPEIVFCKDDKELFTIYQISEKFDASKHHVKEICVDNSFLTAFSPFIRESLEILNHGNKVLTKESIYTVVVQFKPHIEEALRAGKLELVPSKDGGLLMIARNVKSKKFAAHGRMVTKKEIISKFRPKELAAATMNIVSFAVGQYHLAEIHKELKGIKKGIDDIKNFLINQQVSNICGSFNYIIDHIYPAMMQDTVEYANTYHNKLEDIYHQTTQIIYHLEMKNKSYLTDIQNMKRPSKIFNEQDMNDILKTIGNYKTEVVEPYMYCVRLKLMVLQMLSLLIHNQDYINEQRDIIRKEFDEFIEKHNLYYSEVNKKVDEIRKNPPILNSPQLHEKLLNVLAITTASIIITAPIIAPAVMVCDRLTGNKGKEMLLSKIPTVEEKCCLIEKRSEELMLNNQIEHIGRIFDMQYSVDGMPTYLELSVDSNGNILENRLLCDSKN